MAYVVLDVRPLTVKPALPIWLVMTCCAVTLAGCSAPGPQASVAASSTSAPPSGEPTQREPTIVASSSSGALPSQSSRALCARGRQPVGWEQHALLTRSAEEELLAHPGDHTGQRVILFVHPNGNHNRGTLSDDHGEAAEVLVGMRSEAAAEDAYNRGDMFAKYPPFGPVIVYAMGSLASDTDPMLMIGGKTGDLSDFGYYDSLIIGIAATVCPPRGSRGGRQTPVFDVNSMRFVMNLIDYGETASAK